MIVFSSSVLRRINHNQNRFFAVYDTAIKENIAHAEIVMTNYPKDPNLTKKQRKKIRFDNRSRITEALIFDGFVVNAQKVFEGN